MIKFFKHSRREDLTEEDVIEDINSSILHNNNESRLANLIPGKGKV